MKFGSTNCLYFVEMLCNKSTMPAASLTLVFREYSQGGCPTKEHIIRGQSARPSTFQPVGHVTRFKTPDIPARSRGHAILVRERGNMPHGHVPLTTKHMPWH